MRSVILYDQRTSEIVRSQVYPVGTVAAIDASLMLAASHIPENEWRYYSTLVVDGKYLTNNARAMLRIVDGQAVGKPTLSISAAFDSGRYTVTLAVGNTLRDEQYDSAIISVDGVELPIVLTDNVGTVTLEFTDPGTYTITCNDERFQPVPPVTLEVV